MGIVSAQLLFQLASHLQGNNLGSLEDGLVGKHQTHVAIDTYDALLQTIGVTLKVRRYQIDTLYQLTAYQRFGFVQILRIILHMDIGRGITHTNELARQM